MHATVAASHFDTEVKRSVTSLLSELEHYRRQSELLQKVNTLHHRLAGILDLPTMLETYSIWMAEHIGHDLVGYFNSTHDKMHMYCSSHGPQRRYAITVVEGLLREDSSFNGLEPQGDMWCYRWHSTSSESTSNFVIVRRVDKFTEEEVAFLEQSLAVIDAPLKRALAFEEIFSQARKDPLTDLPNRFVLEERITGMMEQAKRYNRPLTLAALDLDHFKSINDTLGHFEGDRILQRVASELQQQIRVPDLLVRMGGDEFLLVLPDTNLQMAQCLAERLCRAIDRMHVSTATGKLGISIGLCQWRQDMSKEQWLETADDTLYRAKARGKAQVVIN